MRRKLLLAVPAVLLLTATAYLGATLGLASLRSSDPAPGSDPGALPQLVYRAPETVPTTDDYGPPGAVSLVYAGTDVQTGLVGEQENPWITVSAHTGDYRALSAPHRPPPATDAIAVAPDGTRLAWGYDDGVVVYDTVTGEVREVPAELAASPRVGPFSPDGSHVVVYDGSARVLELATGRFVATLAGVGPQAAAQMVWTPAGEALTYVAGRALVSHVWRTGTRTSRPTRIEPGATLAWAPSGDRLAALREVRGVRFVEVFDVAGRGAVIPVRRIERDGYAIQELVGFSGESSVAVTALRMESGPLTIVYAMSTVDDREPMELTQLPGPGTNWVGPRTLQVAAEPLAAGSVEFAKPRWPWSDRAKLVASAVAALFVAGAYLTRPASRRRRA